MSPKAFRPLYRSPRESSDCPIEVINNNRFDHLTRTERFLRKLFDEATTMHSEPIAVKGHNAMFPFGWIPIRIQRTSTTLTLAILLLALLGNIFTQCSSLGNPVGICLISYNRRMVTENEIGGQILLTTFRAVMFVQ